MSTTNAPPPGWTPGPQHQDELLLIWENLSAEGKKVVLLAARTVAKEEEQIKDSRLGSTDGVLNDRMARSTLPRLRLRLTPRAEGRR
jgi:hypothetical protein